MKYVVLTGIVVLGFWCAAQVKLSKRKSETPSNPSSSVTVVNTVTDPSRHDTAITTPPWYKSPEWWLMILGFPSLGVIAWQSYETSRSAHATERNVDVLMNAERPWVFLTPQSLNLDTPNRLDWTIENRGRGIARIAEIGLRCKRHKGMEKMLAEPPDYGGTMPFHMVPIAPNGSLDAWSYIETDSEMGVTATELENILKTGDDLISYGFVRYEDSFGTPYESRFCYYYAKAFSEFRINLRAPADYHRCT